MVTRSAIGLSINITGVGGAVICKTMPDAGVKREEEWN
jgi:hypothetical protein